MMLKPAMIGLRTAVGQVYLVTVLRNGQIVIGMMLDVVIVILK